jgi:acetolactate decarboxylase
MKQFFILLLLIIVSCNDKKSVQVEYTGALMRMMSGDISATIKLSDLEDRTNLYALGAIENLKGEIQIFNGEPIISSVENGEVLISSQLDKNASLLVYAEVDAWDSYEVPTGISTSLELQSYIVEIAKVSGVGVNLPFPFLLQGEVDSLSWHVIDWKNGDTEHSHVKHQTSGLNGVLENEVVEVLGFYSENHKGIFTHHTSNVHLHFRTSDLKLAGHVDELELGTKMILKLPKQQ